MRPSRSSQLNSQITKATELHKVISAVAGMKKRLVLHLLGALRLTLTARQRTSTHHCMPLLGCSSKAKLGLKLTHSRTSTPIRAFSYTQRQFSLASQTHLCITKERLCILFYNLVLSSCSWLVPEGP